MAELLIKVGDQPNGMFRDGDVVHAWNDAAIAAMWVRAEINEPEWSVGRDRRLAPLSDTMLREFLVVRVADFDDAMAEVLESMETDEDYRVLRKRLFQFDWRKFAKDEGFLDADIEDRTKVVEPRGVAVDRSVYVVQKPGR